MKVIIILQTALYFTERVPLRLVVFSVVCHLIYLQNFSESWPLISLLSPTFLLSCLLVIADHFLWFFHFANQAQASRQQVRIRFRGNSGSSNEHLLSFWETTTFFCLCVWFIPVFLFLSLSANDNALPRVHGIVIASFFFCISLKFYK